MGKVITESTYNMIWNLILNIWFVGFFIGIWFSPILNDKFGRKKMSYEVHQLFKTPSLTHFIEVGFLIGCGVAFLGALLRLLAVCLFRPELLIVGRFITSMCEAVTYQSCILYLQECSPTNLRGMMTFLSEISFSSMCLVGMFLGTRQLLGDNLVAFMGFAVPFCAFFFIALCFLPETPKYLLIVRSNTLEAERSIRFYHGIDCDVDTVIKEIIMEAEGEVESATASWNSIKEIFIEPHLRRAVLLSISALQNTVPLWSMLLSSTYFLEEIGLDHSLASWCSTAMTLGYTIGTVAGSTWIERFGRRTILLSFTIVDNVLLVLYVMCAELSPFVDSFKYGCLVLLVIYAFVYGSGVGPISWFISSELVPQKYRSLTQSICYALNTVIVVILTFSILPLYIIIKSYAFLILFTIPSTVSIVILYCYLPETKGREIHEIVDELRGKTKSG
ncbi:transporter, major facilitator family protein [Dictyocaulus viviparus]|uniref:Transporter, major facilitator family protein n=1 Tax=Dictyocaulus viviparus TaxID=29172 RepID=A0A0D8XTG8_DICVI|nr:transporter, major facilitator family protein [Dictyocaulus viviparus]